MDLVLIAYESIVAYNAKYAYKPRAVDFIEHLNEIVTQFADEVGVDKKNVYWNEIDYSDWCLNMVFVWAKVPTDWKPTSNTLVFGGNNPNSSRPDSCKTLDDYMSGYGKSTNHIKSPPTNPHNLFYQLSQ